MTHPTPPTAAPDAAQATVERMTDMLRVCIAELRELGSHTIPTRAENLLAELAALREAPLPDDVDALARDIVTGVWTRTRNEAVDYVARLVLADKLADRQRAVEAAVADRCEALRQCAIAMRCVELPARYGELWEACIQQAEKFSARSASATEGES